MVCINIWIYGYMYEYACMFTVYFAYIFQYFIFVFAIMCMACEWQKFVSNTCGIVVGVARLIHSVACNLQRSKYCFLWFFMICLYFACKYNSFGPKGYEAKRAQHQFFTKARSYLCLLWISTRVTLSASALTGNPTPCKCFQQPPWVYQ